MNRIKELREEKGLTLRQLSKEVDIPASTLSRYEQTGKTARKPKIDNLFKLSDFFGVSIGYIQGRTKVRDSFYNEDDPFNAWVNATAVHQDKEGNAYFDDNFRADSIAFLNDMSTRSFYETCKALNTIRHFSQADVEKNKKLIKSIDSVGSMGDFVDAIEQLFQLSLYAYNGDKKARDALKAIKKVIYDDYLGISHDYDDLADSIDNELDKD